VALKIFYRIGVQISPDSHFAMGPADDDERLVDSPLSQHVNRNGATVQVEIYDDQEGKVVSGRGEPVLNFVCEA